MDGLPEWVWYPVAAVVGAVVGTVVGDLLPVRTARVELRVWR